MYAQILTKIRKIRFFDPIFRKKFGETPMANFAWRFKRVDEWGLIPIPTNAPMYYDQPAWKMVNKATWVSFSSNLTGPMTV